MRISLHYGSFFLLIVQVLGDSVSGVNEDAVGTLLVSVSDSKLLILLSFAQSATLPISIDYNGEISPKKSGSSALSSLSLSEVTKSSSSQSELESPPSKSEVCLDSTCNTENARLEFSAEIIQSQSPTAAILVESGGASLPIEPASEVDSPVKFINLSNITQMDLTEEDDIADANNSTEDCRFMSFEEWKKKKSQDAEAKADSEEADKLKEAEIVNAAAADNSLDLVVHQEVKPETIPVEDQGRTYKDRFNYASADCAATVVSTNSDAKGASSILKEVKDSYLLNKCSTPNKFVVIELCQDILVSLVVVGNFELFSSMFKSIKISVSNGFPTTEWKTLGVFEAENKRDLQNFDIENPLIWARYLRIDILSHFGNEFYCPMSLVRVHGTTMMEEFKNDDQVSSVQLPKSEETIAVEESKALNYSTEVSKDDDECRVVLPHLALNEFLKDINSTQQFCNVSPVIEESTSSTQESTSVKTTQESIFKTIVKRLSLLESNASLSLLYVEEQSKLLSDAFTRLEKRHASKFDNLVSKFNQTVFAQVAFLESSLDIIKGESKKIFESQTAWITTMETKNSILTRELSFQRKIIVIDTLLILALLAYVIITKEFTISEETPSTRRNSMLGSPFKQFPVHSNKRHRGGKKRRGRI